MIGYSTDKGGVEAYIENLTANLSPEKFEVIYSWPQMVINNKKWISPINRHNYLKYYQFWRSFFKENKFDVVYYNTCDIVSIDMLKFAKLAGVPVRIIHSHNSGNQQEIGSKLGAFHRFTEKQNRKHIERYATNLFACSDLAGKWMFDTHQYEIIKNGIDLKKYQFNINNRMKCRQKIGLSDDFLIGCIGRLDPQKNPFYMLDIAENLLQKKSNAKIIMIGDGEMKQDLLGAVRERGLGEKILFVGAVDNVNEWVSAIDCLAMPSLFEGLPFVLVEAQAAGLPCIVSSNVSTEANLTGLVQFEDLESGSQVWTEKILKFAGMDRANTDQQMITAGYSIIDTANKVSKIILDSLK